MANYNAKQINSRVMKDTVYRYGSIPELIQAVENSKRRQYMVAEGDSIHFPKAKESRTEYVVSGKRSFEAAKGYPGKKVAVLNYANNHDIGGAPFSAGAQEESLCRCSTLYPCLQAMYKPFYLKHQEDFRKRMLTKMGNDDLIYTPDVVVFKKDERTDPIEPKMLPKEEWYKVDIITCAAPEMRNKPTSFPAGYRNLIYKRLKRILDVAALERNEVLILGAWGCGAFGNSIDTVASVFMELLPDYDFETVEFAIYPNNRTDSPFNKAINAIRNSPNPKIDNTEMTETIEVNKSKNIERFKNLLRSTNRTNIENVIEWADNHNFYEAAGSFDNHNVFNGGLLNHSLEVYDKAMELNRARELPLPEDSVTLCSLLHDVCKADQYIIDADGNPQRYNGNINKGHGRRSMFILKRKCKLPLNYDEEMAIWWHMGDHEKSLSQYKEDYNDAKGIDLCVLIHQADSIAATHALRKKGKKAILKQSFEPSAPQVSLDNCPTNDNLADQMRSFIKAYYDYLRQNDKKAWPAEAFKLKFCYTSPADVPMDNKDIAKRLTKDMCLKKEMSQGMSG